MNTTSGHKIGLASALGALIGGFVAWYLAHTVWAALLGSVVAATSTYLAYEWRKVAGALHLARVTVVGWTPDREYWRNVRQNTPFFLQFALMVQGVLFYIFLIFSLLLPLDNHQSFGYKILSSFAASCSVLIVVFLLALIYEDIGVSLSGSVKNRAREMRKVNIVSIPFFGLIVAVWAVNWSVMRVPVAFRIAWKMAKTVFFKVHCEERVQAVFYGTAGLLVGHFTTHAIAGVLIGAASGYLLGRGSYKLISVRLLKPQLAP